MSLTQTVNSLKLGNYVVSQNKDNGSGFIRQSFLRGHLAPAFQPPTKHCPQCKDLFRGMTSHCLPCRKANRAAVAQAESKSSIPDSFLDNCQTCKARTLHLGPGWCTDCFAVAGAAFPLYCEECVLMFEVPVYVTDDRGGQVSMLEVENLWCVKCGGVAESWMRMGE
ncbi:Fc.00g096470.m01.CDS01 [Cosmosporella sp. VM-42]